MPKTIAVIGTLDTKGQEFAFLKAEIERRGCKTLVIDAGILDPPAFAPDVSRDQVVEAAEARLGDLIARQDRGAAIAAMTQGVAEIVRRLYANGTIDGIISMGGGGGTSIGTTAMRALPVGFPKVMVSTLASGDVSAFVGTSDIVMMPAVVGVSVVNRISRMIYANAAGAITGMVTGEPSRGDDKPVIAATMFGNTTRAVNQARTILEGAGYEVIVLHATGTGGRTMETLVIDGLIQGVLDMTTTEWADELVGGVLSAGPNRLEAAARSGVPQVVVPGCLDMVNFWARDTVPSHFEKRTFYQWNQNITLMRTTVEENRRLGEIFADKLNAATGPVAVYIPTRGYSELDREGEAFWNPEADRAFADALKANLRDDIPVVEMPVEINDPEFSRGAAETLLAMLRAS
mgnify:CR=1 FL=1